MGQTITEKILAAHAGRKEVRPGEFIRAKVDLGMGNDITAPIAIRTLEREGLDRVWDKDRLALVLSHFVPAKDIASAGRFFSRLRRFRSIRQGAKETIPKL